MNLVVMNHLEIIFGILFSSRVLFCLFVTSKKYPNTPYPADIITITKASITTIKKKYINIYLLLMYHIVFCKNNLFNYIKISDVY